MSGEHGDESQRQTSEEIEYHIEVVFLLHQSRPLVHEGREGGESSAEPREIQYLMPPPKKLPMLTINISFISLYNIVT